MRRAVQSQFGGLGKIVRRFSTYNKDEVSKFGRVKDWWDPEGSQKGLHAFNPIRIDFVKKGIFSYGQPSEEFRFLKGKRVLDVGSGAGIFAESIARFGGKVTGLDASEQCVEVAKEHMKKDHNLKDSLDYHCSTIGTFIAYFRGIHYKGRE